MVLFEMMLSDSSRKIPPPVLLYAAFFVMVLPAIITEEPLELGWMPDDPGTPARVLGRTDVDELLARLRGLGADGWTALSTYFEVAV